MCDLYRGEEAENGPRQGMDVLVDELVVASTNMRIYWKSHPRVQTSVHTIQTMLEHLFRKRFEDRLLLGVAEGCLFFETEPLLGASVAAARVIRRLEELGTGGISFGREVQRHDVEALIAFLGQRGLEASTFSEANLELERNGCRAISFLPSYRAEGHGIDLPPESRREAIRLEESTLGQTELAAELEAPVHIYQNTVELLQDSLVKANQGEAFELESAKDMVGNIFTRLHEDAASMRRLTRYERYDAYTFGHSIRVCTLALSFASQLLQDRELVLRVGIAGLLHDIGKAWVPFEVLHSTSRLNPEERLEMNKHAEHGARILLSLPDADPLIVAVAFGHHRTHDGGGYPEISCRTEQSIGTRIVKICDVYEALTATRPYKAPMTPAKAYRVMLAMKDHFDPGLLRRFVQVNGLFPIGTDLAVADGMPARVVGQSDAFDRPIVRLLDAQGNFTAGDPVDLSSVPLEIAIASDKEPAEAA